MNTLYTFSFDSVEAKDALILEHSDRQIIQVLGFEDGTGELTFSDMAQEKYIKELEDQLLLLADELSGGIL